MPGIGHITASLGVATFPFHASSRDSLVTTADRALYQAKHLGRNRTCTPPDPEPAPIEEVYGELTLEELASDEAPPEQAEAAEAGMETEGAMENVPAHLESTLPLA
jgi:hypothetical protein